MLTIQSSGNTPIYGNDIENNIEKHPPSFMASNQNEIIYSNQVNGCKKISQPNSDLGYVSDVATPAEPTLINKTRRNALLDRINSIKNKLSQLPDTESIFMSSTLAKPVSLDYSTKVEIKSEYHSKFSIPVKKKLDTIASLYQKTPGNILKSRTLTPEEHYENLSSFNKTNYSIYDIDPKGSLWKYQVANRLKKASISRGDNKNTGFSKWQHPEKSHRQLTDKFSDREVSVTYMTHLLIKHSG